MAETRTPHARDTQEVDFPNLHGDLHALDRMFFEVRARLWQLEALFDAMGSLDSLQTCITEELVQISNLVDMGRDVARLGETKAEALDTALDRFEDRLFREPATGDAMPLEILAEMLEIAATNEPTTDNEVMHRRVEMANILKGYVAATEDTEMGAVLDSALDAWLAMLDRQGAQLSLVPWASGYQQYRYNWRHGFGPVPQRRTMNRSEEAVASA